MKSFSGLVRYKDIEKLRLPNDTTFLNSPFMPIDDLCIVEYDHHRQVLEYATLDTFETLSCVEPGFCMVKADSSFHLKAYSCLNIECLDCGKRSSRLSIKNVGQLKCYECLEPDDVFDYDKETVIEMFSNATITKLYPRWRWRQ